MHILGSLTKQALFVLYSVIIKTGLLEETTFKLGDVGIREESEHLPLYLVKSTNLPKPQPRLFSPEHWKRLSVLPIKLSQNWYEPFILLDDQQAIFPIFFKKIMNPNWYASENKNCQVNLFCNILSGWTYHFDRSKYSLKDIHVPRSDNKCGRQSAKGADYEIVPNIIENDK